jgi:hypothetical protein
MLIQAVPEEWPGDIKGNLATVIEAVRPSFYLAPKLHLHHDTQSEIGIRDLPGLLTALEDIQTTDWAISLRWDTQQPPEAALPALRKAAASAQAGG